MDCEDEPLILNIGQWGYVVLYDRARRLPPKPFRFGFTAPEGDQTMPTHTPRPRKRSLPKHV